jgi:para-nitrobenzyl esterase
MGLRHKIHGLVLKVAVLSVVLTLNATAQAPGANSDLEGSSWQLVRIEGSDGKVHVPQDRSRYMLAFAPHGELSARIDCNRGSGTWSTNDSGALTFGELATTRASCAPGSLYDLLVSQWTHVRLYALRGGHLFITLPGDGTYEFEPLPVGAAPAAASSPAAPAPPMAVPKTTAGH